MKALCLSLYYRSLICYTQLQLQFYSQKYKDFLHSFLMTGRPPQLLIKYPTFQRAHLIPPIPSRLKGQRKSSARGKSPRLPVNAAAGFRSRFSGRGETRRDPSETHSGHVAICGDAYTYLYTCGYVCILRVWLVLYVWGMRRDCGCWSERWIVSFGRILYRNNNIV